MKVELKNIKFITYIILGSYFVFLAFYILGPFVTDKSDIELHMRGGPELTLWGIMLAIFTSPIFFGFAIYNITQLSKHRKIFSEKDTSIFLFLSIISAMIAGFFLFLFVGMLIG